MLTPSGSPHTPMEQVAERKMRLSAIGHDVVDRLYEQTTQATKPKLVHPYVCISREAGAMGEEIAQALSRELSWVLLDRKLLHDVAERGHIPESMLQNVDERRWSWLMEIVGGLAQQRTINHADYVLRVGEMLRAATQHAPSVIVGRGAQFVLPSERGLTVRVVAPRDTRVKNLMAELGLNEQEAGPQLDQTDSERDDFVRRFFFHDPRDPHLYDLVINTGTISPTAAAALLATECRRRFPEIAFSKAAVPAAR